MSSVKRYEVNGSSSFYEDEKGSFVDYEDYAALEAKCAALAAELNAVEAIHDDAVLITDDHYEQCPPEVQEIIRSLAVMQIPAYKAFLAEVRAQGVEMAAQSDQFSTWVQQGLRSFAIGVRQGDECSDELRKGVQS